MRHRIPRSEDRRESGLPVEDATKYAIEAVGKMSEERGGGGGLPDWVQVDIGFETAHWVFTFRQNPGIGLGREWNATVVTNDLFLGGYITLPREFPPSRELTIPQVVLPNLASIPAMPDHCSGPMGSTMTCVATGGAIPPTEYEISLWNKEHWTASVGPNRCSAFNLYMLAFGDNSPDWLVERQSRELLTAVWSTAWFGGPLPPGPVTLWGGFCY